MIQLPVKLWLVVFVCNPLFQSLLWNACDCPSSSCTFFRIFDTRYWSLKHFLWIMLYESYNIIHTIWMIHNKLLNRFVDVSSRCDGPIMPLLQLAFILWGRGCLNYWFHLSSRWRYQTRISIPKFSKIISQKIFDPAHFETPTALTTIVHFADMMSI